MDGTAIPGGWMDKNWVQVGYQLAGSLAEAAWSFVWTFLLCFAMQKIPGLHLRLKEEDEIMGADIATMGETYYTINIGSATSDRSLVGYGYPPANNDRRGRKIEPVVITRPLNKL